ncbi:hypothetical protein [Paenibacillus antarcticus]|uniref:hypothetical protein n=1 Tax=Paenibacillus antarcticus TaxID=253703 RepID=UPI0012EE3B41|nr:hypothetical protein [Paenibacillus antarcticus]
MWIVGALMILSVGLLKVLVMKYRLKKMERRLVKVAIQDESWQESEQMTLMGIHYTHPSFKRLDELLSSKDRSFQNVVVFLDAPPFIHLLKQRAWNSCRSVRHTPEWSNSRWLALLNGETVAYQWDGQKLHHYTEVEMLLERKIRVFQLEEEQLCTQQSADNFL